MMIRYFIGRLLSDKLLSKDLSKERFIVSFAGILIGTLTDNIGSAFGPVIASAFMVFPLSRGVLELDNMLFELTYVSLLRVPCAFL